MYAAHFKPPPLPLPLLPLLPPCAPYATVHTRLIKSLLMNSVNDFYGSRALMKIEAVQCRGERNGKGKKKGQGKGQRGGGGQCSLGQCVITLSIIQSELADARKSARRQFVRISGSPSPLPSYALPLLLPYSSPGFPLPFLLETNACITCFMANSEIKQRIKINKSCLCNFYSFISQGGEEKMRRRGLQTY